MINNPKNTSCYFCAAAFIHQIKKNIIFSFSVLSLLFSLPVTAQITERERPAEWDNLITGARFMDRFLPMQGENLTSETWGADYTVPRFIDNGIEDRVWSYWGGNIIQDSDSLYHLLVCGWLEMSPKGHMEWPQSYVFNTVSENLNGPYTLRNVIGKGHNPEVYQLSDGRYVLYVIDGRYVTDDLNGVWEPGKFEFNPRDRKIIEGLSNLSFARRDDGSFIMVCRGGGIWISKDGLSEYAQITDKSVYPDVDGHFEDPVIWRDSVQYHMIVNDWLGRIAYYLRSKNGIEWVIDPGEAYMPGIAFHADGHKEDWFKYERIKIYQDESGRAIQANFAVIDTIKWDDKPHDNHSSKNITIPLNPGVLLEVLNQKPITTSTREIRVKIKAEAGFDPQKEIDLSTLRFGSSEAVNWGKGASVLKTENDGADLIVVFEGENSGITPDEFAPKLIGNYKDGSLLFGYARVPYIEYIEPVLSARAPVFTNNGTELEGSIEIENFGQVASGDAFFKIEQLEGDKKQLLAREKMAGLQPYEKKSYAFRVKKKGIIPDETPLLITIYTKDKVLSTFRMN